MIETGIEIPLGKYARTLGTYVGRFFFGVSKEVLDELHSEKKHVQYGFHQYAKINGEWHEFDPPRSKYDSGKWEKM